MVKIEIRMTFLLTLICGLQNLSGKLQNLSGKLQINVSKNVNRISINHKIKMEIT